MTFKPFKSWLLWDATDTYSPTLHFTRYEAEREKASLTMIDAKWRIVRVEVRKAAP